MITAKHELRDRILSKLRRYPGVRLDDNVVADLLSEDIWPDLPKVRPDTAGSGGAGSPGKPGNHVMNIRIAPASLMPWSPETFLTKFKQKAKDTFQQYLIKRGPFNWDGMVDEIAIELYDLHCQRVNDVIAHKDPAPTRDGPDDMHFIAHKQCVYGLKNKEWIEAYQLASDKWLGRLPSKEKFFHALFATVGQDFKCKVEDVINYYEKNS